MHPILIRKLTEVLAARRQARMRWGYAVLLILASLAMLAIYFGVSTTTEGWLQLMTGLAGALVVGVLIVWIWSQRTNVDLTDVARDIESNNPDLRAALLTAIEQQPGVEGFGYMQTRVIEEAVRDAVKKHWATELTERDLHRASLTRALALVLFATGFGLVIHKTFVATKAETANISDKPKPKPEPDKNVTAYTVEVTPGNTEVEKGSRLVVEAKFADAVPPGATLVILDGKGAERSRSDMRPTVDPKVFGGMIASVKEDGVYRVEFDGGQSADFKITTFEHPQLLSSDAKITPPSYAKQPAREIKNTFKVTALEGSEIGWTMKVNKPVKNAELFADAEHVIPLKPDVNDGTTLVASMQPDQTRKYRLHLVDDHERANKEPPWFHITVQANQMPKIEIDFPKRDIKVSTLQEVPLEAKIWDDLGVDKAGAVIELASTKREVPLPLGEFLKGKKTQVKTLLNLEPEKVEPMQMVSYYFWAEDKGPKGETRRTMSDLFFAEVREFDDVYRESESPPSDEDGEPKSKTGDLLKLQKEIVNANWHLVRDLATGRKAETMKPDVDTVKTSQSINDENTAKTIDKTDNVAVKQHLEAAQAEMKKAVSELASESEKSDASLLSTSLASEQRALRHLFMAQSNEHNVTKSKSKSKSQSQEQQERELLDLELKQKDQRYEEEKAAGEEKTAEQKENLAVLNRLKELARRQEALAQKIKELDQQMAQAKTEEQKEELQNQLKRLQDEQEQMLRDLDDVRQKMEQPENSSQMADAKKQLDETREKVNEALEHLKDEKLSSAQASATRAQKDLEQARDDFRQRTAKRFSEEMKTLRDQARDLASEQQKLSDALENQKKPEESKNAFDTSASLRQQLSGAQAARQIDQQQERAQKLMEDMKRVSEQSEDTDPLLHKHLYEALRSAHAQGLEENLKEASTQVRYGDRTTAQDAEHRAGKAVEDLKTGVEKAAESVLGNESDTLRMARAELDKLIDEAKADKAGAGSKADSSEKSDSKKQSANGTQPGEQPGKAKDGKEQKMAGQPGENPGNKPRAEKDGKGETGKEPSGQDKQPGTKPGEGTQGVAEAGEPKDDQQPGQSKQPGGKPGEGKPSAAEGGEPQGQPSESKGGNQQGKGKQTASNKNYGGGGNWFFDEATEAADNSAITGDRFDAWSDRLRSVEDMLTRPDLRNEAAKVLDHARNFRADNRKTSGPPQIEHLNSRILKPLVELRDQVTEELARREGTNPLSPVDRDPVPENYRELVQKYYQQLGAGK